MKRLFVLVFGALLSAPTLSWGATYFDNLTALFNGSARPTSARFKAEEIWVGKCVAKGSPNTLIGGALYFHVTSDPVLGTAFRAVPSFRYYVGNFPSTFQNYIYLKYVEENAYLKRTADVLMIDFYQKLRNANIDYSLVGATADSWTMTTRVNLRSQAGVNAVFVSYIRETTGADGKPLFVLRHDITEEKEMYSYTSLLGPAQYCYFSENKGVRKVPTPEQLIPETGEMPMLPTEQFPPIP